MCELYKGLMLWVYDEILMFNSVIFNHTSASLKRFVACFPHQFLFSHCVKHLAMPFLSSSLFDFEIFNNFIQFLLLFFPRMLKPPSHFCLRSLKLKLRNLLYCAYSFVSTLNSLFNLAPLIRNFLSSIITWLETSVISPFLHSRDISISSLGHLSNTMWIGSDPILSFRILLLKSLKMWIYEYFIFFPRFSLRF